MPIELTCSCGRSYRIKETLAGRKIRCPDCDKVLRVPIPAENRDVEQEAGALLLENSPDDQRANRIDLPEESLQLPQAPKALGKPDPGAPTKRTPRPKVQCRKGERRPWVVFEEGWFGSLNSGVIGGLLTMLIAGGLFVAGLAGGRIFIYAPVLFVLGFIAFIKGLFGAE